METSDAIVLVLGFLTLILGAIPQPAEAQHTTVVGVEAAACNQCLEANGGCLCTLLSPLPPLHGCIQHVQLGQRRVSSVQRKPHGNLQPRVHWQSILRLQRGSQLHVIRLPHRPQDQDQDQDQDQGQGHAEAAVRMIPVGDTYLIVKRSNTITDATNTWI